MVGLETLPERSLHPGGQAPGSDLIRDNAAPDNAGGLDCDPSTCHATLVEADQRVQELEASSVTIETSSKKTCTITRDNDISQREVPRIANPASRKSRVPSTHRNARNVDHARRCSNLKDSASATHRFLQ